MIPGLTITYGYLSANDHAYAQGMVPENGTLFRYGKVTAYDGGFHKGNISVIWDELFPLIKFNSLSIRVYHEKQDCKWHMDKPAAGELITIYSAIGTAEMAFRPIGTDKETHRYTLPPNSLTQLSGSARWGYEHAILPVKDYRVSFVFRNC